MTPTYGLTRFKRLLPIIGLIWLFFFLRVHDATEHMRYFIDELNHINRARIIYTFSDLHVSTTPGKFLLYYWLGLFDLAYNLPGWVARVATVIAVLPGAAGTYALGKELFGRWAGMIALALLCVFPFMVFHERLALTDPLSATFVVLVAWWSLVFVRKPTLARANILGALICLMLLAKLLAGPVIFLPLAAIALMSSSRIGLDHSLKTQIRTLWQRYKTPLTRVALINGVVWGFITTFYVGRGLIDPTHTNPIVDDYIYTPQDRLTQLKGNITHVEAMFSTMWGMGLSLAALIAVVLLLWKRPRHALYLLSAIIASWIPVFVLSARPNSRYFTTVGHLWLVLIGGTMVLLWTMARESKSPLHKTLLLAPYAVLLIWGFAFGSDFTYSLMTNPTSLELPQAEKNGYYRNFTWFALGDAVLFAAEQPPISNNSEQVVMVGFTRGCDFLHYGVPAEANLKINCLDRFSKSSDLLDHQATYGDMYAVMEQFEPLERLVDFRWVAGRLEWLTTYERPFGGFSVDVYILHQTGWPIGGVRPSPWN